MSGEPDEKIYSDISINIGKIVLGSFIIITAKYLLFLFVARMPSVCDTLDTPEALRAQWIPAKKSIDRSPPSRYVAQSWGLTLKLAQPQRVVTTPWPVAVVTTCQPAEAVTTPRPKAAATPWLPVRQAPP